MQYKSFQPRSDLILNFLKTGQLFNWSAFRGENWATDYSPPPPTPKKMLLITAGISAELRENTRYVGVFNKYIELYRVLRTQAWVDKSLLANDYHLNWSIAYSTPVTR